MIIEGIFTRQLHVMPIYQHNDNWFPNRPYELSSHGFLGQVLQHQERVASRAMVLKPNQKAIGYSHNIYT